MVMVLSPILAWSYSWRVAMIKTSIAAKFALGFAVVAIGFFIYGFAGQFAVNGKTLHGS